MDKLKKLKEIKELLLDLKNENGSYDLWAIMDVEEIYTIRSRMDRYKYVNTLNNEEIYDFCHLYEFYQMNDIQLDESDFEKMEELGDLDEAYDYLYYNDIHHPITRIPVKEVSRVLPFKFFLSKEEVYEYMDENPSTFHWKARPVRVEEVPNIGSKKLYELFDIITEADIDFNK